ncbi:MAG TPA: hypothetical protein VEQ40_12215, partial [Pyrinomonadaceae bacterium]|nr:hypothetical protein [Pyrinomonadaceae bacterium]
MIEVRKTEPSKRALLNAYFLTVHGRPLTSADANISKLKVLTDGSAQEVVHPLYDVTVYKPEPSRELIKYRILDISKEIHSIELRVTCLMPHHPQIEYDVKIRRVKSDQFEISLNYYYRYNEWKYLWSTQEF